MIQILDGLGGTTAVARMLNIRPPSVHAWRKSGIPRDRAIILAVLAEQRGITTRQELFPQDYQTIWPELADDRTDRMVHKHEMVTR